MPALFPKRALSQSGAQQYPFPPLNRPKKDAAPHMGRERPGERKKAPFSKANHKKAPPNAVLSGDTERMPRSSSLICNSGWVLNAPKSRPNGVSFLWNPIRGGMSAGSLGFLRTLAPLGDSIPVAIGDPVCGSRDLTKFAVWLERKTEGKPRGQRIVEVSEMGVAQN